MISISYDLQVKLYDEFESKIKRPPLKNLFEFAKEALAENRTFYQHKTCLGGKSNKRPFLDERLRIDQDS